MSETLTPMARSSMPAYLNQLSSPDDIGQNEVTVLLTKKGLELRQARPEIESLFLPEYIKKVNAQYLGSTAVDSEIKTRDYIWRGEDAEVYELAPGIAVREVTKRADPMASVDRMSVLSDLADDKLPEWIGVPDQYGVVIPESTSDAFVAMQKVNSGINVDWLLEQDFLNETQRKKIKRDIGEAGPRVQAEIRGAYLRLEEHMHKAVADSGRCPEDVLPDLHEGNVLVERLPAPIDDQTYKMWVIDQ